MKKKNEENRHAESLEESLETLFGRESDLTDEELDEELEACGIDAAKLQADVHKQLAAARRRVSRGAGSPLRWKPAMLAMQSHQAKIKKG